MVDYQYTNLLIVGAGSHSQVVREVAESLGFRTIAYLDDNKGRKDVIGTILDLPEFKNEYRCVFVSVGDNALRKKFYEQAITLGYEVPSMISPMAYVSKSAKIGKGSLICPMSCIQSGVVIGDGCFISSGAVLDHNVVVGAYAHINSGVVCLSGTKINDLERIENKLAYKQNNN